ncbi:hypothetical protein [Chondromyces crocatus]|uniref:Uncharacterized protein n=1 Tax=Chondromyces crocatus TaxID=52 RepID=A0A0K1EGC0_CHOCO|nr:hypothetical protein [Chondromyces crocatus]AKT39921.1 uncharacterized protein CMC5_040720 [Chondromyces crocatus]
MQTSLPHGAAAPSAGPPWPYPEPEPRVLPRSRDHALGWGFLFGGALLTLVAAYLVVAFDALRSIDLLVVFVTPGVGAFAVSLIGVFTLLKNARRKRRDEEVAHTGIRCWGRIVQAAPIQGRGHARSYLDVYLVVEAFAAHEARPTQGPRPYAAGTRVAAQVAFEQHVSLVQMGMLQPGYFCALVLHPSDHGRLLLDGFATPQGAFARLA